MRESMDNVLFFEYDPGRKEISIDMEKFFQSFGIHKTQEADGLFETLRFSVSEGKKQDFMLWLEQLEDGGNDLTTFYYESRDGVTLQITMIPFCEGNRVINYVGYLKGGL